MFGTQIGRLRLLGMLEGSSFVLLLFVAMPLKYLADRPEMVRVVGMAHGLLFVAFVFAVLQVAFEHRWPIRRALAALAASVLPFGPFILDARLLRGLDTRAETGTATA